MKRPLSNYIDSKSIACLKVRRNTWQKRPRIYGSKWKRVEFDLTIVSKYADGTRFPIYDLIEDQW